MEWSYPTLLLVSAIIFAVAALYSCIGHGGATSYLAVLALFSVPPAVMSGTALVLNVLVAGLAFIAFTRAGHLSVRISWPFLVASIPAAFIGGMLKVSDRLYFVLLAVALLAAALRLTFALSARDAEDAARPVPIGAALPIGGGIGLVSGMVGIGGGVLLSPVMILKRWASNKQTAATAALFILMNSVSGLSGRLVRGNLEMLPYALPVVAALAGGLIGSHCGAQRFTSVTLRRILAFVLALASVKMLLTAL